MNLMAKMICYFLCVLIVSSIGFGVAIHDSYSTKEDINNVMTKELPRLEMADEIRYNVLLQASSIRAFLLNQNEEFLRQYKQAAEDNVKLSQKLLEATRTEERRQMVRGIAELNAKYSEVVEQKIVPAERAKRAEESRLAQVEAVQHYEKLLKEVVALKSLYTDINNKALIFAVDSAQDTINISTWAAIISVIIGMLVATFSARSIARKVAELANLAKKVADGDLTHSYKGDIDKDEIGALASSLNSMVINLRQLVSMINSQSQNIAASSEELTSSADQSALASQQVAGAIAEVAGGTTQQLNSVKTANDVVENMVAELEEASSNISIVATGALKTAEMAANGGQSATKAISQMNHVEKTVRESAKVVAHLGERSKEIGQIVDTISGIAGQTNLLALNAAIEAARAGEQGRGFAVVAEEVRKLAEQSQEASKKIAELIGEIQVETTRAVAAMNDGTREVAIGTGVVNDTGVSFQEIIGLINQVSEQINGIAKVVHSVASGSEKVVSSVNVIRELSTAAAGEMQTVSAATEEQSASMEEIAAASQNLAKMAETMQQTVERFRT
jgi:methyl-accepting chemotaxis protein